MVRLHFKSSFSNQVHSADNNSIEKGLIMGKHVETPRYNIVSMRVSDAERDSLQLVAKQLSINMSEMMRRAMQHFKAESGSMQLN